MKRAQQTFENLPAPTSYDAAMDKAMKLLAVSARSRHEIRDRLNRAGYDAVTIRTVDSRLIELGLVDDVVFAEDFVERAAAKGQAPAAIRAGLAAKGVDQSTVRQALADCSSPEDERIRAMELATRRVRSYGSLPRQVAQRRLMGFLAGKGYDFDLIKQVCAEALGTSEENEVST